MKRIEKMRRIVEHHQAEMIDDIYVDTFSASAYIQIYDALNKENKAKQESVDIGVAMDRVWKLVDRLQDRKV